MQSTLPLELNGVQDLRQLPTTRGGKVALTVAATAFVALCAHISLPLYFTPVPLTLQDLAVLLVGLALGPTLGFSAMALYLAEGAIGLPVFNPHGLGGVAQLLGPTGGFLFAYPLAAAAAGTIVRMVRSARLQWAVAAVAGIAFSLILFAFGAGWFSKEMHLGAAATWHMAVAPFLPGAILKISAAAAIYSSLRRWQRS
jgi:biotin transport system substrate-specific component